MLAIPSGHTVLICHTVFAIPSMALDWMLMLVYARRRFSMLSFVVRLDIAACGVNLVCCLGAETCQTV